MDFSYTKRKSIKLALKQFLIKTLLALLRGLVVVKRHLGPLSRALFAPVAALGRFFVRVAGVPLYRLFFLGKRSASRVILPAKNRALYFVSNRYAIHVAVVGIAAVTSVMNFGGSEVRAEDFGQHSMLYALVAEDDSATVDVVAASDFVAPKPSSYMDDAALDPTANIDLNYTDQDYVTTAVGGSIASPTIKDGSASVAPRTEVETYTVQNGDVLGSIAESYGLSLSSLLWANNLTFRSTIRPGQTLTVPPTDGVLYKVKSGDTVNKIAKTYSAEADKIIAFNALSGDNLVIGEQIMIPDGEPPAPAPAPRTAPITSLFTGNVPRATSGTGPSVGGGSSTTRGSAGGSGSWVWPTDWRIITQYFGWKHTGVDIDGDYSTQSYAAADGVVIYSGWRNGYGNCIEIDHGNGLVTRYAHHSKLYVKVGQVVSAGEAIGQTGTTGHSTGTHLHFEVIKNGKFQNPLDYIR